MASKKQVHAAQEDAIAIIFQKEYTFGDKVVKFTLDARNYEKLLESFHTRLNDTRNIKGEDEFPYIQNADPVFDVAYRNLVGNPDENRRIEKARQTAIRHYMKLSKQTLALAGILAMVHGNTFENEPTPYEDDEDEYIEGLGEELPKPKPELTNPTEYRLKQLSDILDRDTVLTRKIMEEIHNATTTFEQRVKAGALDNTTFRPLS